MSYMRAFTLGDQILRARGRTESEYNVATMNHDYIEFSSEIIAIVNAMSAVSEIYRGKSTLAQDLKALNTKGLTNRKRMALKISAAHKQTTQLTLLNLEARAIDLIHLIILSDYL